jgi:hypothetical protein
MDLVAVPNGSPEKAKTRAAIAARIFSYFKYTGLMIILGQVNNRPSEIVSVTYLSNLQRVRKPIVKYVTSPC